MNMYSDFKNNLTCLTETVNNVSKDLHFEIFFTEIFSHCNFLSLFQKLGEISISTSVQLAFDLFHINI
jgi:hypothetical protein